MLGFAVGLILGGILGIAIMCLLIVLRWDTSKDTKRKLQKRKL